MAQSSVSRAERFTPLPGRGSEYLEQNQNLPGSPFYHSFIHLLTSFIYLAVLGLSYGTRDLCCGMQEILLWRVKFSLVVARGLVAPWHVES